MSPSVVETGHYRWLVTLSGRSYSATYHDDPDMFPLDKWEVRNSRGVRKAWDSAIARSVESAIRNHVQSQSKAG